MADITGLWIQFNEEDCSHRVSTHPLPGSIHYNITMDDLRAIKRAALACLQTGKTLWAPKGANKAVKDLIDELNEQIQMDTEIQEKQNKKIARFDVEPGRNGFWVAHNEEENSYRVSTRPEDDSTYYDITVDELGDLRDDIKTGLVTGAPILYPKGADKALRTVIDDLNTQIRDRRDFGPGTPDADDKDQKTLIELADIILD